MLNTHHISRCCFLTHPINHLHSPHRPRHRHHHRPATTRIRTPQFSIGIFNPLSAIENHQNNKQNHQNRDHGDDDYDDCQSLNRIHKPPPIYLVSKNEIEEELEGNRRDFGSGILSNMWWADLKAAVGQRVNVEGLLFSVSVITRHKHWVIPHVSVPDVRYIDWAALKRSGYEGVVFDKDNTLTVPYSLALWGPLAPSVESCKSVFGDNIAVFSNSAGNIVSI